MSSFKVQYTVDGEDFSIAGDASRKLKKVLQNLGVAPQIIRKATVAMYEGEINMVIHADGGVIDVEITPEKIHIFLRDKGPGIPNVSLAMTEGYSTASDNVRELGFGAGMGLPNMQKYTDYMNITTEVGVGTTIEMIVNTAV
ncbi:MAG: ATP-binding protein [Clostridia bacterium]|jgi:anti-sigma regulatory factor (Ser/Thr protein kinase)|nr:ATP-binding protein [Clostridia bacterium]